MSRPPHPHPVLGRLATGLGGEALPTTTHWSNGWVSQTILGLVGIVLNVPGSSPDLVIYFLAVNFTLVVCQLALLFYTGCF